MIHKPLFVKNAIRRKNLRLNIQAYEIIDGEEIEIAKFYLIYVPLINMSLAFYSFHYGSSIIKKVVSVHGKSESSYLKIIVK